MECLWHEHLQIPRGQFECMAQTLMSLLLSCLCSTRGVLASPLLGTVGSVCPQLSLEGAPCTG